MESIYQFVVIEHSPNGDVIIGYFGSNYDAEMKIQELESDLWPLMCDYSIFRKKVGEKVSQ